MKSSQIDLAVIHKINQNKLYNIEIIKVCFVNTMELKWKPVVTHISTKPPAIYKLNNTILNNLWVKAEIIGEFRKYFD